MSTIKSSDEHLTLNADGTSKDIKFQANGVEKASISSAGAFTSTTIDATALTGALPAISGAALTNLPAGGVDGITSSAGATAMTIDANEVITITQPNGGLDTSFVISEVNGNNPELLLKSNRDNSSNYRGANIMSFGRGVGDTTADVRSATISMRSLQGSSTGKIKGNIQVVLANDDTSASETVLELFHDRRAVSQFTARAWAQFEGDGTPSFRDSHNCSSLTDNGTGTFTVNYTNNMANTNYCAVSDGWDNPGHPNLVNVLGLATSSVSVGSSDYAINTYGNQFYDYTYYMVLVFGD